MKTILFTEIGENVGYGHLSRCISLAYALEEKHIYPKMIISGSSGSNISELDNYPTQNINWLENPSAIPGLMQDFDIGIFDSYHMTKEILTRIDKSSIFPVFIDDMNLIEYPRGLVINSAFSAFDMNYKKKNSLIYLLGPTYLMLKKEFWKNPNRILRPIPKCVLVTWGANDIRNLSPRIIAYIQEFYPKLNINLIITSYSKNIKNIDRYLNSQLKIILDPSTEQIREVMLNTDIAITAGGQTSLELVSMDVPSIIITTAENQIGNVKSMSQKGVSIFSGRWNDPLLMDNFEKKFVEIQKLKVRQNLIYNGRNFIKSDGSRKIVEVIIKVLKK